MKNRKRNVAINIRVYPHEKRKIMLNAEKCQLNLSEYIRKLALGHTPKEAPRRELFDILAALQKLKIDYDPVTLQHIIDKLNANLFSERR